MDIRVELNSVWVVDDTSAVKVWHFSVVEESGGFHDVDVVVGDPLIVVGHEGVRYATSVWTLILPNGERSEAATPWLLDYCRRLC